MDDKTSPAGDIAPGARRAKLEQQLRRLEVEAYCALVSAFRAQGELTWKKAQLLQDLRQVLRVPEERHKMELKRVSEDETLIELAKLSAGLHMGQSELDATMADDDARRSRAGRKKAGNTWGDSGSRDRTLPYLDAVVASASSQPPNLSKIPPATSIAKGGVKAKGAAARPGAVPAASAKAATPGNRKRKAVTPAAAAPAKKGPLANKKREAKPKAAAGVKAEGEELQSADLSAEGEELAAAKLAGEEDEEPDEAHIKEVEEQLRAKQEQLRAELAALQAEMEDDEEEQEDEDEEEQPQQQQQQEGEQEGDAAEGLEGAPSEETDAMVVQEERGEE